MDALLEAWQTAHGDSWQIKVNPGTGYVEMLFGGNVPCATQPSSDGEFVVLAWLALSDSEALHGIDADTLTMDRVTFLPLAQVGSTDKMAVRFREEVGGVPVRGGFVNVLLAAHGALLAVQSTGLPHLSGFGTDPSITAAAAQAQAVTSFTDQFGVIPNQVDAPELIVAQATIAGGARVPRLAWLLDVYWTPEEMEPEGRRYTIDAGDGSVIASEPNIHSAFDVSGIVTSNATPGTRPDTMSNPPIPQLMPHNVLFLGWMEAYDQQYIDEIIEIQWLTLDDDDGDLCSTPPTPHSAAISAGFRLQGFPGLFCLGPP